MKYKILCAMLAAGLLLTAGCDGKSAQHTSADSSSEESLSDAASEDSEDASADEDADYMESETTVSGSGETMQATKDIFAMDTYMTLTAYGENCEEATEAAADEIERLNALLSTGNADSEVGQINANGGGTLSEDTSYLLKRSLELYESTDGRFDVAIYPIMDAWGFTTQNYQVPSEETLSSLMPLIDASNIIYDEENATISFSVDGMEIDFGGIAKGYTSSRLAEIFKEYGVTSALVNLGGNVQVIGGKTDGTAWRVAVQDPEDTEDYIGVLSVMDKAVITSGGYERYFDQDGVTYHHIIDPSTGYPADSGLISVTIVTEDGTLADGLSTSLFIMGKDDAVTYWRAHSDEFDFILVDDERNIYISEGISDAFEPLDSSDEAEVISYRD